MTLRKLSQRQKPPLAVKPGKVSSTVHLAALAIPGAGSYEWHMSSDEKAWTPLPGSKAAKTTVTGLPLSATLYFRVRGIIKTGPTNWSQIVSIIVT